MNNQKLLAVWSLPTKYSDNNNISSNNHELLVVSNVEKTYVYRLTNKLEIVTNSGFNSKPSLHVDILKNDSFIQIIPDGIMHFTPNTSQQINISSTDNKDGKDNKKILYSVNDTILAATSNGLQIALALKGKEIIYFELDKTNNKLRQMDKKAFNFDITCINIGPVPQNREKCKFLAVGGSDKFVRIMSLEIQQCLVKLSMQEQSSIPNSVLFILENKENSNINITNKINSSSTYKEPVYSLYIGGTNGTLMKASIEHITGNFTEVKVRNISNPNIMNTMVSNKKPAVNIFKLSNNSVIAVSNYKPLLCYSNLGKYYQASLNYFTPINFLAGFNNENVYYAGIVVSDDGLKLLSIDNSQLFGDYHVQHEIKLRYTPRKICYNNESNCLFILESDQNVLQESNKNNFKKRISSKNEVKNVENTSNSMINNINNSNSNSNENTLTNLNNKIKVEQNNDEIMNNQNFSNKHNISNSNTNISNEVKGDSKEQLNNSTNIVNEEYLKLSESVIGVPQNINDYILSANLNFQNPSFSDQLISRSTLKISNFSWASCIRVLNPTNYVQYELIELECNEAALTMQLVNFQGSDENYLVVSTAKFFQLTPISCKSSSILIFSIKQNGRLEFLHRTMIDDVCFALCELHGRLVVGVGNSLSLYDLGKKQLLKKYECKRLSSFITKISVSGQRVFVATMNESVMVFSKFLNKNN